MTVLSVRLHPEDAKWIKAKGLKPSAFVREAVHLAIKRAEIEESHAWLEKNSLRSEVDSTAFIRRDRDSR